MEPLQVPPTNFLGSPPPTPLKKWSRSKLVIKNNFTGHLCLLKTTFSFAFLSPMPPLIPSAFNRHRVWRVLMLSCVSVRFSFEPLSWLWLSRNSLKYDSSDFTCAAVSTVILCKSSAACLQTADANHYSFNADVSQGFILVCVVNICGFSALHSLTWTYHHTATDEWCSSVNIYYNAALLQWRGRGNCVNPWKRCGLRTWISKQYAITEYSVGI